MKVGLEYWFQEVLTERNTIEILMKIGLEYWRE